MPVNKVTTPPPSPTGGTQTGNVGSTGGVNANNQPTPSSTSGDLSGARSTSSSGNGDIFMRPPKLDASAMMVQMTSLQSQLADTQVKLVDESIKGQRTEMLDKQKKRIAKLQDYFKSQNAQGAGGFFGKLFNAVKCLFTGDFKGFGDNLGEAFSKDTITGILFSVAMIAANLAMPGIGTLIVLAAFIPAMMGDEELMGMAADMFGLEGKARDDFMKSMKWIGFGLEIIVDLAIAIAVSVVTAGAAAPVAIAIFTTKAVAAGAREAERGTRDYLATKEQAKGLESSADADRLQADSMEIQTSIDKDMGRLTDFYDAYTSIIQSTTQALQRQYDAQRSTASV